jgi:hypothetical protein
MTPFKLLMEPIVWWLERRRTSQKLPHADGRSKAISAPAACAAEAVMILRPQDGPPSPLCGFGATAFAGLAEPEAHAQAWFA